MPSSTPPPRTSISRYPSHLSRCSDKPPRPLLHRRGTSHMYESLEDLLAEAGYKETRIFTPEAPERPVSNSKASVGGAVVKLLSTWMSREPTPVTDSPTRHPVRPLRHSRSTPQISRHRRQAPPSPSWLTSLFIPRTPPSTPSRRCSPVPRLLSHPRAASSHVVVTRTNVVCRPTPVRLASSSSTSTRFSAKARSSSRSRGAVPSLLCQSHQKDHNENSPPDSDDDDSDEEGELDLSRILIPAKRQHSIRSLRTVLLQNPPHLGTPARRISSLNPSRDRPRRASSNENQDSHSPPPARPHLHYQSSLPLRMTREPLQEESAHVEENEVEGDGVEGHWDSGEFMSARIKRRRSGLPRGWAAWGR